MGVTQVHFLCFSAYIYPACPVVVYLEASVRTLGSRVSWEGETGRRTRSELEGP